MSSEVGTVPFEIATATTDEVKSGVAGRRMREFNYGVIGEYGESSPVWLNAKDAAGDLAGALRGFVFLNWLAIDILWVREGARGQRLGSRLLAEAESRARLAGAGNARLETFQWQAAGFYAKHGYREYARIDDFVAGQWLAYMRKEL